MIRAWIEAFTAALDLRAAEMRAGILLIEAVAAEKFTLDLRAVVGTESVDEYREIALDAAKCGLRPEEANAAFAQWIAGPHRTLYELEGIKQHIEGRIRRYE